MVYAIHVVVGARPNQMKAAPLLRILNTHTELNPLLIDTGQHCDHELSRIYMEQFGMLKNVCERIDLLENGCINNVGESEHIIEVYHGRTEPSLNSSPGENG
jgi:UDP-N-acetylglucosamine 2-epimerase